jgi:hypothetical protein
MNVDWKLLWVPVAWAGSIAVSALVLMKAGAYGLVLFAFLPFAMGWLVGWYRPARTTRQALTQGAATAVVGCAFFIVIGVEGLICTVMALPFAIPLGMLGSVLALMARTARLDSHMAALLVLPIGLGSAGYDVAATPPLYEVTTSIEVAASPHDVWQHVVSYAAMPEPAEWVFATGIGYPRQVRMDGVGVGATRYCDFSTGSFVEPITVWEPGRRLEFDVVESPAPMKEWSPYGAIEPTHLHGYFVSRKGRFVLTRLANGHTQVEGTSWYQHHLEPGLYWRWWSDAIIHRIHHRVLTHIKTLSESDGDIPH